MPLRIRIENGQGIIYAMKYFNIQGVNRLVNYNLKKHITCNKTLCLTIIEIY